MALDWRVVRGILISQVGRDMHWIDGNEPRDNDMCPSIHITLPFQIINFIHFLLNFTSLRIIPIKLLKGSLNRDIELIIFKTQVCDENCGHII